MSAVRVEVVFAGASYVDELNRKEGRPAVRKHALRGEVLDVSEREAERLIEAGAVRPAPGAELRERPGQPDMGSAARVLSPVEARAKAVAPASEEDAGADVGDLADLSDEDLAAFVADNTIDEIVKAIGGDPIVAYAVLSAERDGKNRSTLIEQLESITS